MSTLITFLAIAALAAFVYRYMPKERQGSPFHLEQFRPAAPLAGIFDDGASPATAERRAAARPGAEQSSNRALDCSGSDRAPQDPADTGSDIVAT
ncbi:hypothetical protein GS439_13495 [Rhodococcus hoagii]|nr:hypothetical protein [Prescottella equi]